MAGSSNGLVMLIESRILRAGTLVAAVFSMAGESPVSAQQQPKFVSQAKLVAGGRIVAGGDKGPAYQEYLQDFYGTIIETIESNEMRRRALDRTRALHPDLKESEVETKVTQNKGSAIFNVRALGTDPKYTRVFLDSLLDEFIGFRNQIREQQKNKALTKLAEDVVRREKNLQERQDKLTAFFKANNTAGIATVCNILKEAMKEGMLGKMQGEEQLKALERSLTDILGALEERERKGAAATGLTRLETDYLKNRLELVRLVGEKTFLTQQVGASDPKVTELGQRIARLEAVIQAEEKEVSEGLRRAITNRKAENADLAKQLETQQSEAQELAGKIATHEALEKDYQVSKRAYDEILDLVRKLPMNCDELTSDTVTVMERASAALEEQKKP